MNRMAEQLQAIANAMAAGQNGGTGGNGMRQEGLDARAAEEIPTLDDDLAYSQVELQKLKEQMESITREMKADMKTYSITIQWPLKSNSLSSSRCQTW